MHTPQRPVELSTSLGEAMQASADMEGIMCCSGLLQTSRTKWAQPYIPRRSYYLSVPDYVLQQLAAGLEAFLTNQLQACNPERPGLPTQIQ